MDQLILECYSYTCFKFQRTWWFWDGAEKRSIHIFLFVVWKTNMLSAEFVGLIFTMQIRAAIRIWVVSSGHSGWLSTWAAWLLAELWKSLGDRADSCNIWSEGLPSFHLLCLFESFYGFCSYYCLSFTLSPQNYKLTATLCYTGWISSMGLLKRLIWMEKNIEFGSLERR